MASEIVWWEGGVGAGGFSLGGVVGVGEGEGEGVGRKGWVVVVVEERGGGCMEGRRGGRVEGDKKKKGRWRWRGARGGRTWSDGAEKWQEVKDAGACVVCLCILGGKTLGMDG